jgi:DNA-binding transcriptional MerR regulator
LPIKEKVVRQMPEPQDGLPIGELARHTGVPAATLRSWELRYGFPRPRRLAGGHRRYGEQDIARVADVLRLRAAGTSLPAAVTQATALGRQTEPSVFAGLRRRHPDLAPQVMRKVTLLALTRAIEDECCARAGRAALFVSFQEERFYRRSQPRWEELARTSPLVVVFAAFIQAASDRPPRSPGQAPGPVLVSVPADAPLRREWVLVCDSTDSPGCLAAWEFPGQQDVADGERQFEVLWSADPQVVRDAATICAGLAQSWSPGAGDLLAGLPADPPPPASADLRRATSLLSRMTGYLEAAGSRQAGRA